MKKLYFIKVLIFIKVYLKLKSFWKFSMKKQIKEMANAFKNYKLK